MSNKSLIQNLANVNLQANKEGFKKIKAFNMNFGPQHPAAHGVLRMILQLNGETIEKVDTHIGLLHRGTEKLIETKKYLLGLPYFDRLDYCSMLAQEHAYCLSVESLNYSENNNLYNLTLRTLFDELTRILNHLLALACHALDVGSMSSIFWAFEEREYIMEFYERVSGARMHAVFYRPFDYHNGYITKTFMHDILLFSRNCIRTLNEMHNVLTYNKIWKQRLINVGLIGLNEVKSYSLTGVLARSTGFKTDLRLRKVNTYGSYYNLNFQTFLGWNGDCFDRYLIRLSEMVESLNIINQIVSDKLNIQKNTFIFKSMDLNEISSNTKAINSTNLDIVLKRDTKILKFLVNEKKNLKSYDFLKMINILIHFKKWTSGAHKLKKNISFRSIESPKGEFGVTVVGTDSSVPFRCKIRSPSYYNLRLVSKIAKGHFLADLVTIIGTIDIVFGEVDR